MTLVDRIAELRPWLMRRATKLTRNNQFDADDLTQNALVKAIEKQHLYRSGNLGGWLGAICYHQFITDARTMNGGSEVIKPTLMEPIHLAGSLGGTTQPNQEHWVSLVEVVREMSVVDREELFKREAPKIRALKPQKPCKKCGTTLRYAGRHCVQCKKDKDTRISHEKRAIEV